jgi:hypothetical protein
MDRLVRIYIVYNYSLRFDREVVDVVVFGYIVYNYCLKFDRGMVRLVDYIVYNYLVRFKNNHNITKNFSVKP